MADAEKKGTCFVIMPISTPDHLLPEYRDDKDHFDHVLTDLFSPALAAAGFDVLPPKASGSEVIHAEIIKQLAHAELVLCDLSTQNPNVFFELGIRTALNKPVVLVADDKTPKLPFDTVILNCHTYDSSLVTWKSKDEITRLTEHILSAHSKSDNDNAMWKYFGIPLLGNFSTKTLTTDDKVVLLLREVIALRQQLGQEINPKLFDVVRLRPPTNFRVK